MEAFHFRFKGMGSPCEVVFYFSDAAVAQKIWQCLHGEFQRLEQRYSRYREDSVVSAINRRAGSGLVTPIDHELQQLLHYADVLYHQSDGLFDISSGVLRRAWDFKSQRLPEQAVIDALLPLIGWPQVHREAQSIYLPRAGMALDFGGIVKEYAADVLATLCLEHRIQHGLINLGGDLRVLGPHPDGKPWQIGIQHPRLTNKAIAVLPLSFGALATSGDYERFMEVQGTRYTHLMNPRTGWPVQPQLASVSVCAPQCVVAGSLASVAMLHSADNPRWIAGQEVKYLAVDQQLRLSGSLLSAEDGAS